MNVLEKKLSWILEVAERIQKYFKSQSSELLAIVERVVDQHGAIAANDMIASDNYPFMILASDPRQLFMDIIEELKKADSIEYRNTLNPILIFTKLVNSEYMLDLNGTRLCYCVKSSVPSNYLLKSFACRRIALVHTFFDYIDDGDFKIKKEKIEELNPTFDYGSNQNRIIGKGKNKSSRFADKNNPRKEILARLIEYVRNNSEIARGVIFVNDLSECSNNAMNIMYSEYKYKDAIEDFLKLLISNSYSKYSFKCFRHNDFSIPYDFKLVKHSCLIKQFDQPIYIANLYNSACYNPIPCVKSIIGKSFINNAHPIVKLRLLYLDMYLVEHKTKKVNSPNLEGSQMAKMVHVYNELLNYDKLPSWVGVYKDDNYEKNQVNLKSKDDTSIETMFI